jgi:uncharacterized protein YabN with tetrapyrrole methylase and pyrophosphatase domain
MKPHESASFRAVDLFLLGTGIKSILHLTTETIQALQLCREVHVLHDDIGVLGYVESLGVRAIDLAPLYAGHTDRHGVYREISERLVAVARERSPVGFLVHGNPLFLVSASEYTFALAESAGLRVEVLPAVSSFDSLLCDLRIDFGYEMQIFDASTMLLRNRLPDPELPLLVFQLATTLQPNIVRGDPSSDLLEPLCTNLLKVYPPDHLVSIVVSSVHVLEAASLEVMPLRRLAGADLELWRRPTLYVPPCSPAWR